MPLCITIRIHGGFSGDCADDESADVVSMGSGHGCLSLAAMA
jgi:hypothetical protein